MANIQGLLEQGKRALREGNKFEAQTFLLKVVELDKYSEDGWLWLASAVDTAEEQRTCLDNVLVINPDNTEAKRMVAELARGGSLSTDSLFENPSTPTKQNDDAFSADIGFGDFGGAESASSPFVGTANDDDPFGDGDPFSAPPASGASSTGFSDDPFGGGGDPFGGGPFSATTSAEADPFGATGDIEDQALFDAPPKSASKPYSAPPAPTFDEPYYEEPTESLDDLGLFDDKPKISTKGMFSDGTGLEIEDEEYFEPEEINHLDFLPDHIKPTRIPGTNETVPRGLMVGIGVVGVLNVLAIVVLILQIVL